MVKRSMGIQKENAEAASGICAMTKNYKDINIEKEMDFGFSGRNKGRN